MNRPVLQIFGAMLIHETFRESMIDNAEATLQTKGYQLNADEMQVMLKIVQSFADADLEESIEEVRIACPDWPCNDGSLAA